MTSIEWTQNQQTFLKIFSLCQTQVLNGTGEIRELNPFNLSLIKTDNEMRRRIKTKTLLVLQSLTFLSSKWNVAWTLTEVYTSPRREKRSAHPSIQQLKPRPPLSTADGLYHERSDTSVQVGLLITGFSNRYTTCPSRPRYERNDFAK